MKALYLLLLLALALSGQDKPEATTEKPDPIKKARELLDGAAEMLGGTQPQIQIVGLWHIGDNYQVFDRKKALEFFKQAFAACPTLPPEQIPMYRKRLQVDIVNAVAGLEPDAAAEMLKQIGSDKSDSLYDSRRLAIMTITTAYLAKSQLDKAIGLIEAMGGAGVYSFESASMIFKSLPTDDPRRQSVFGSALAAFDLHPNEGFKTFLALTWKDVPPTIASSALRSFLNYVLDKKPDSDSNNAGAGPGFQARGTATAKGAVFFSTAEEHNLFDVMWIVREIEPKRAEEILQKYPELKASLEAYPRGMQSMYAEGPSYGFVVTDEGKSAAAQRMVERMRMQALIANQKLAALQTAVKEPDKALELARSLPNPSEQVEVLTAVVRSVGEKDPAKARSVLNRCMAALADVKDPGERIQSWDVIAEAADLIKDDKLVREAIDRGLSDAAELYKLDEEDANSGVRLQEYWPSTTAYRRIILRATRIYKTDAESILVKIADPNLNLLARIAMAQGLLGRQPKGWQPYQPVRRKPR